MLRLRTLDPELPIECRLAWAGTSVALASVFRPDMADERDFLKAWANQAAFLQRPPPFISAQFHRAIGDSPTDLNYAVWESIAAFPAAFANPDFRATLTCYASTATASPHPLQDVAVPDVSVA
jgi:hypothetical protein